MKRTEYLIKAREFKYPNEHERKQANKDFPSLDKFGFEYKNDIEMIFGGLRAKEVERRYNLYWWDECLGNRVGFLRETYIYLITQKIRGLKKEKATDDLKLELNTILFEYYLELFYHFFTSTRDIILQIINLYFSVGYKDHEVSYNTENPKKFNQLPHQVLATLNKFYNNTSIKKAIDLRNSFTHRYTPTGTDYRLVFKIEYGKEVLAGGGIKRESNQSFLDNVQEILAHLATLLVELRNEINPIT
jgi:hypothetical protein